MERLNLGSICGGSDPIAPWWAQDSVVLMSPQVLLIQWSTDPTEAWGRQVQGACPEWAVFRF